jgi:hypothetical protein
MASVQMITCAFDAAPNPKAVDPRFRHRTSGLPVHRRRADLFVNIAHNFKKIGVSPRREGPISLMSS